MDKLLAHLLVVYKSNQGCGIDSRGMVLSILTAKEITDKQKGIFLSIMLNPEIGENLLDVLTEYQRLSQLENPWCSDEQLENWY